MASKTKVKVSLKLTPGQKVQIGKALDEIQQALDGSWSSAVVNWSAMPATAKQKVVDVAPLFARFLELAKRVVN